MFSCNAGDGSETQYRTLRERMVSEQIAARGVTDERVLKAMQTVERHLFVPPNLRHKAYNDSPLPIGEGQTISQPYIVALMTEALKPDRSMNVLEIGTGSGYQAAVLSLLCNHVYTVEIIETLGRRAQTMLSSYRNISIRIGDGYNGWKEHAPFDAIIVTCAPTHLPAPLVEQLKEGGTMIIPFGERGTQELVLLTKKGGSIVEEGLIPVRFVPMVDSGGVTY
ncbi:MAG: protein-L-isoaspartate(D-aspartate) O-methyltransferase [Chitinispirillaceae bacterium]|nr:protein-L-isoaspartate(D-aspartate) O-methyltransferase [Chitinispirillaceae bacterium]